MPDTPHQIAEAQLTAFGLSLPETDVAGGWGETRYMRVAGKGFAVFGDKDEPADNLTIIVKLPISYDMVQHLPFVSEGSDWYRKNKWVRIVMDPHDDILAEIETLKAWMVQSYVAMAPKRLGKQVMARFVDQPGSGQD